MAGGPSAPSAASSSAWARAPGSLGLRGRPQRRRAGRWAARGPPLGSGGRSEREGAAPGALPSSLWPGRIFLSHRKAEKQRYPFLNLQSRWSPSSSSACSLGVERRDPRHRTYISPGCGAQVPLGYLSSSPVSGLESPLPLGTRIAFSWRACNELSAAVSVLPGPWQPLEGEGERERIGHFPPVLGVCCAPNSLLHPG